MVGLCYHPWPCDIYAISGYSLVSVLISFPLLLEKVIQMTLVGTTTLGYVDVQGSCCCQGHTNLSGHTTTTKCHGDIQAGAVAKAHVWISGPTIARVGDDNHGSC